MPTEFAHPGVYVEELPAEIHAIDGVATSITAFVGRAQGGPFNEPVQISSIADFERQFGDGEIDGTLYDAISLFFENGGREAYVVRVGSEGEAPIPTDFEGSQADRTGFFALDNVETINILTVPGQSDPGVQAAAAAYALARRAFAILDLPSSADTPQGAREWMANNALGSPANVAAYFPQLLVSDPTGGARAVPNSGAVAGVYARTDLNRGIWHAPAGVDATIEGAVGLACQLQPTEEQDLNSLGMNALRTFNGSQVVWGARTLAGGDASGSDWKYVPVRRLALFIEESIDRGLGWASFEPNDENLWAKVRLSVGAFLQGLFRQGAFAGIKPSDAYFVRCDRQTVSQQDLDSGNVNVLIGIAPVKPAEFVILKIGARAQPTSTPDEAR